MTDSPNIVYFHVDNLGLGELGCYGGGILRGADTQRIDRFAAESLKLSHFVVEPRIRRVVRPRAHVRRVPVAR
jgi:arylsulfatase A-like enzyme